MTKTDNMNLSSDALTIVRRDYFHILEHINLLVDCLKVGTVSKAEVFALPYGELDDVGADEVMIKVSRLSGEDAFNKALSHLLDFELRHENQAGVMAQRLPGVICIQHPDENDVRTRVVEINRLKKVFEQTILQLANHTDTRFELVSTAVPNLIRKAFTRNIMVGKPSYSRIGFSWVRLYSQSKADTKENWVKKIELAKGAKKNSVDHDDWVKAIEMEKQQLMKANDAEMFRTIRPLRVTPMMNIRDEDTARKQTTKIAHSPIWFINQDVTIGELNTYMGQAKADAAAPVVERLHLYKVM